LHTPPLPTPAAPVPNSSATPSQSASLPMPPLPVPPPPAPPSTTSQPNPTKNAAPESDALDNTLDKLRALQKQEKAPTAKYNPAQATAPAKGGVITGDVTSELTSAQRGKIGEKVRECWTKDAGALDLDKMSVMVLVTVDGEGIAREVQVAPEDAGKLSDPRNNVFFERARRAILSPRCSTLLSKDDGTAIPVQSGNKLKFRFRP
jgi:hypothetical protein